MESPFYRWGNWQSVAEWFSLQFHGMTIAEPDVELKLWGLSVQMATLFLASVTMELWIFNFVVFILWETYGFYSHSKIPNNKGKLSTPSILWHLFSSPVTYLKALHLGENCFCNFGVIFVDPFLYNFIPFCFCVFIQNVFFCIKKSFVPVFVPLETWF